MKHIFSAQSGRKKQYFRIEQLLQSRNIASYKFSKEGEGFSNWWCEFKHNVSLAKSTVFVVMFSNWYYQRFTQVSKEMSSTFIALRSINPSPYLFFWLWWFQNIWFFWSPNYRKDRKAKFIYSRNFQTNRWWWKNAVLTKQLSEDKKKIVNMWWVDLARNDLSERMDMM
jgi:anthranilate synthase component 1